MMRRSLINFWFLLLLFLSGLPVQAQFIIENSAGDLGTSPVAEDINVCFEQEDALSFRLIATEAISAPLLSIELALGREYLDGTAAIVSQSGGFLLGPNTGTATQPQFIINGDFASGDFIEISLNRVGNCEAINQNGLTDRVSIAGSSEVSSTHDALFLTLSISGINPVTTNVGDMLTLDGQVIGGGNGCVEALVLMVYDEPGVTTNELRVEGNVIPLDSTVNDTLYYTLGLAEITQVGDSDECLEALETLDFERDVTITSCEVGGGYVAWWGCNDERCFQTEFTDQQINIEFNVPDVNYTGGSVPQPTNLCDTIIVRHDFTNVGTGAAFNVRYFAGFGASGLILSGNTGGAP